MLRRALRRERASEREETRLADQARGSHWGRSGRFGIWAPPASSAEALGGAVESAPGRSDGRVSITLQ